MHSQWLSVSMIMQFCLFGLWGWWIPSSLSKLFMCSLGFYRWQYGHQYPVFFCHTSAGICLSHPGCMLCEHVLHSTSSPPFLHFAHTSSRFPLHLFVARCFLGSLFLFFLHTRVIFHFSRSVTCCRSCFFLHCGFGYFFFLFGVGLSAPNSCGNAVCFQVALFFACCITDEMSRLPVTAASGV